MKQSIGLVRAFSTKRLLSTASTMALGLSLSVAANAQPADQSQVEQVVVTGSRVAHDGFSAPTPVTVITSEDLLRTTPTLAVEGLSQLPSLGASTTRNTLGSSTSLGPGSFLNLRGLGTNRTLVLMDGRRMVPATSSGTVDADLVPGLLLQRVDIVTGGASAAYGSDAVSGVVNFVLDKNFRGLKADVSAGITQLGDIPKGKISVAYGEDLTDKVHLLASADYFRAGGLYGAQGRNYLSQNWDVIPNPGVTSSTPASPTNPTSLLRANTTLPNATYGGQIVGGPLDGLEFLPGGATDQVARGTLRSATGQVGGGGANISSFGNYTIPLEAGTVFGRLTWDIAPDVRAYAQFLGGTNGSTFVQTISFQTAATAFTIFNDNAYLPASVKSAMAANKITSFTLGRVDTDWPFLIASTGIRTYDFTGGFEGDLGGNWKWDASFERGITDYWLNVFDNTNVSHVYEAADAVVGPSGSIVCRTALANPSTTCKPLNLFGVGASDPAAVAYAQGTLTNRAELAQQDLAANISGDLFELWAGPISGAAGIEYRQEKYTSNVDTVSSSPIVTAGIRGIPTTVASAPPGGWQTNNPKPLKGNFEVKEIYGETLIPLAKDMPFAKTLDLNIAARATDYSTSGTVTTYKAGVTWQPFDELRLRATQSRDIRAPNISDLYAGNSQGRVNVTDPFNNNAAVTNVVQIRRGNPALVPEKADTLTYGFVYQPAWFEGFSASLDYWNIVIRGAISVPGAQDIVTGCYQGVASYCSLVTRVGGTSTGTIAVIDNPSLNIARSQAQGEDVELGYHTDLANFFGNDVDGAITLRTLATYLGRQRTSVPTATGTVVTDRTGDIGNASQPRWMMYNTIAYENGPLVLTLTGRYVGGGTYNSTFTASSLDDNTIPAIYYVNFGAEYQFDIAMHPQAYFTIHNLLDQPAPPVVGLNYQKLQTNLQLYDVEGRAFMVGARFKIN